MPPDERLPATDDLRELARGEVVVLGRLPWSSNATFLVECTLDNRTEKAVYKPAAGERELWDFPGGLFRREVAAFELSRCLGWGCVPQTIVAEDAPFGEGSLQRFVDADFSQHYFTLVENPAHADQLRRLALFDVLANNADRKSGHCLVDRHGRIWGIDNGLSFHEAPKLRTVIWDFAGTAICEADLEDVRRITGSLPGSFAELLAPSEIEALERRALAILDQGRLPDPDPDNPCYPWPLI